MKKELCPKCQKELVFKKYTNNTTVIMHCDYCKTKFKLTYEETEIPNNFDSFNWGAFFWWHLWGFWNGMPMLSCFGLLLAFLAQFFFPLYVVGMPISIYIGLKANKLSWKNKDWKSIETFKTTQQNWSFGGISAMVILSLLGILCAIVK